MGRNGRRRETEGEGQGVFPQGLPQEEMYGGVEIQSQLAEKLFGFGGQFRVQMEMFRHGKLAGSAFWFHEVPLLPRRALKSRALAGFAAIAYARPEKKEAGHEAGRHRFTLVLQL